MKHLLLTLLLATLCATGYAQTLKSVMIDTNGVQVNQFGNGSQSNPAIKLGATNWGFWRATGPDRIFVSVNGSTGVTFTSNSVVATTFSGNLSGGVAIGSGQSISFTGGANVSGTRTNLGLGATWLTNTNATNFRTAIGVSPATIWAYKVTNQTNTTTNLVSDTALTFTAAANTKYAVELFLVIGDGADGISAFFASTNSPSLFGFWAYVEPANNIYGTTANAITNEAFLIAADSGDPTSFVQTFVAVGPTNTNATITFQFKKASTDGTAVIGAGSYLKAEVIE